MEARNETGQTGAPEVDTNEEAPTVLEQVEIFIGHQIVQA
jgi:hypothetical protein